MSLTKVTNSMINGAVLNVLDYGAVSGANSTAAFDAAVIAASASKKAIFVPAGTYSCGELDLLSDVTIFGEPGSVIKRTGNFGWMPVDGSDNITIDSLQFDNNAPGTAGAEKFCIAVLNVTTTNFTVRNCDFYNGFDIAIKDGGPDGIYISDTGPNVAPPDIRNNILIENCTFDGFTRNGISITSGSYGTTIKDCFFTNCGLFGIDVEANYGDFTYIRELLIDNCKFIDNGAGSIRGTDFAGGGLQILAPSPTNYHSKNVSVTNCYFDTPTATNSLGINYFIINSTENFKMSGCTFATPVSASTHSVNFESGVFGSQYGIVQNNTFGVAVFCFAFTTIQFSNNQFIGSLAALTSAAFGANKVITNNTFKNCGVTAISPITIGSTGTVISGNTFVESRASSVPTFVIKYAPADTTTLAALDWTISNNVVRATSAVYGYFFDVANGTSTFGVQNVRFRGNDISGCAQGIEFATGGTLPSCFDIDVTDNTFSGLTSVAINMNGVSGFNCVGNSITNCATNTIALNITQSEKYVCANNRIKDTRSGSARSTYAISAQNTLAGGPTSLLSSNLSNNTQSGFTIAAGEGTSVNNTVY
jgi:hypothetical protein